MSDPTPKAGPQDRERTNQRENTPTTRATTPTERGDTDLEGSASSLARQNLPREPNHGQRREDSPKAPRTVEPGLRGVDDKR